MRVKNLPLYSLDEANKVGERLYKTSLHGLSYIDTKVFSDNRGFYREIAVITDLQAVTGEVFNVKQLNHSNSKKNVIRGMHAEDWNKLVTVTHGVSLCVLADVRPDSPSFGKTEYVVLGFGDNALPGALFITRGLANSMCIIEGPCEYLYAVDALYRDRNTANDVSISIFDPDLNIHWPIPHDEMIFSDRDQNAITLREKFPEKFK